MAKKKVVKRKTRKKEGKKSSILSLFSAFLVNLRTFFDTLFGDIATVIIFAILLMILNFLSQGISEPILPILNSQDPAIFENNAGQILKAVYLSLALFIFFILASFGTFALSRHVIWNRLQRGAFIWKKVGKTVLGLLSYIAGSAIILSFPFALIYTSAMSGAPPNKFLLVLFGVILLFLFHIYINYMYQLVKTGLVWKSYALSFEIAFKKIINFLPAYIGLIFLIIIVSFIPYLFLHFSPEIVNIVSAFILLIIIVYSRTVFYQTIKKIEKK